MTVWPPTAWKASKGSWANRICETTFLNSWKSVWDKWSSWLAHSGVNVVDFQCGFFYSSSRRSLAESGSENRSKGNLSQCEFSCYFSKFFEHVHLVSCKSSLICPAPFFPLVQQKKGQRCKYKMVVLQGVQLIFLLVCLNLMLILVIRFCTWPTYNWNIYKDSCSLKLAC